MQKHLIILLSLLMAQTAFAKCKGGGFQFFPSQKEISMSSMFIIEGYAKSQKQILEFKEQKVFLLSENGDLVELKLQKILEGQKDLTQALFIPEKQLSPNTIYYLKKPNNTGEDEFFTQWYPDTERTEKVHWITSEIKANAPLDINLNIAFENTEVKQLGCGPSVYAIFSLQLNSSSEIWFKTEVVNLTTHRTNTYYITNRNNKLLVGHGMCGGAFEFDRFSKYKVRFTPMNTDGTSIPPTDWFEFGNPHWNDN
ncbi:hypothetical protein [Mangrovimonas sp. TPBH4]|uniref:hypothetical protein n=1 Tax=Mangrovimonas sp. TPBH4 TaxID=1645914 RepID=UPI0006B5592A|nr:hypothetical protein [Mangrovimonas sp. TPBH4]